MTLIQPNKTSPFINKILAAPIVGVILTSLLLGIVYNKVANLNHGIETASREAKQTQTAIAELNDTIFHVLDSGSLANIVKANNLVKENSPQYVAMDTPAAGRETTQSWSLASHF